MSFQWDVVDQREKAKKDSEKALKDYLKQQQEDTKQRKHREKLEEYNQFKMIQSNMSNAPPSQIKPQLSFVRKVPDVLPFDNYHNETFKYSRDSAINNVPLPQKLEARLDESVDKDLATSLKSSDNLTKLLLAQEQLSQERRARVWIESELQAGKMQLASLAAKVDSLSATVESDTSIIRDLSRRLSEADKRSKDSEQAIALNSERQIIKLNAMVSELLAKQRQSESINQETDGKQRMMMEELNHIRYKLEAYSLKTNEFGQEVSARSRDLDQELQRGSETFRKLSEHDHMFEAMQGNINNTVEQLQKRIEAASAEIRHRLDADARNRSQLENNMRELHQDIRKAIQMHEKENNDRIESLKTTIFHQADRDRLEKERISANLNEQLRVLERIVKEYQAQFSEKAMQQYSTLEASINDEKILRKKFEAEIRSDLDDGFNVMKQAILKKTEENQLHISDAKIHFNNAIKSIQESLILVERESEKKLQNTEDVLRAEIKARMDLDQRHSNFVNEICEKISSTEEKIGGRINDLIRDSDAENERMRNEIYKVAETLSSSKSRNLDDLESRILQLGNRAKQSESELQSKIQLALSSIEAINVKQVEAIESSEAKLSKAISLLQNGDEDTLKKVLGVELLCSNIKNEIDEKLNLKSTQLDQTMEAFKSELAARVTIVQANETQADIQRLLVSSQKRLDEMATQVNDALHGIKDRITRHELDELEIRLKSLVSSFQARLLALDESVIKNSSQLSDRSLKSELRDSEMKLKEMLHDLKVQNAELNSNMMLVKEEILEKITKNDLLEAEDRVKKQIYLIEDKFSDVYKNIVNIKESYSLKANKDELDKLSKDLTSGIDRNEAMMIQALDAAAKNRESIVSTTAEKMQELKRILTEEIAAVESKQKIMNSSINELSTSLSQTGSKLNQRIEDIIISQKGSYESHSALIESIKEAETENYTELSKRIDEIPEKISDLRNQQHELRQWMIETTQIEGETVARALLDIKHTMDTKLSESIFNQSISDLQATLQKLHTQHEIDTIEINQIRLKSEETEHILKDRIREVQAATDRSQKEIYQSVKQQNNITMKHLEDVKERQSQIPKLLDNTNMEIKRIKADIDDRVHNEIQKVEREIAIIKGALQSRVTESELDDAIGDIIRPLESRIDRLTIDFDDYRLNAENDRRTDISRITPEPQINSSGSFYKPPHRSFANSTIEEEAKGLEGRKKTPEVDPRLETIADNTSEY